MKAAVDEALAADRLLEALQHDQAKAEEEAARLDRISLRLEQEAAQMVALRRQRVAEMLHAESPPSPVLTGRSDAMGIPPNSTSPPQKKAHVFAKSLTHAGSLTFAAHDARGEAFGEELASMGGSGPVRTGSHELSRRSPARETGSRRAIGSQPLPAVGARVRVSDETSAHHGKYGTVVGVGGENTGVRVVRIGVLIVPLLPTAVRRKIATLPSSACDLRSPSAPGLLDQLQVELAQAEDFESTLAPAPTSSHRTPPGPSPASELSAGLHETEGDMIAKEMQRKDHRIAELEQALQSGAPRIQKPSQRGAEQQTADMMQLLHQLGVAASPTHTAQP